MNLRKASSWGLANGAVSGGWSRAALWKLQVLHFEGGRRKIFDRNFKMLFSEGKRRGHDHLGKWLLKAWLGGCPCHYVFQALGGKPELRQNGGGGTTLDRRRNPVQEGEAV